jgi:hypothetical protein
VAKEVSVVPRQQKRRKEEGRGGEKKEEVKKCRVVQISKNNIAI